MSYKYFNRYLSNNEEVLQIFHYVGAILFLKIILCFILFLSAFFFMVPIMKLGIYGLIIFFLIIIFSILECVIIYKKWEYDCLVVTNRVIIRCYWGFIKNNMEEFSLDSIYEIKTEYNNLFAKFFKIGNIIIFLKNKEVVYMDRVFNPKNIKNFILEIRV